MVELNNVITSFAHATFHEKIDFPRNSTNHLSPADLNTLTGAHLTDLGLAVAVGFIGGAAGRAIVRVAASASTAVELDAVATTSNTVAIASAAAAGAGGVTEAGERSWGAAVGAGGRDAGANGRLGADAAVFGAVEGGLLELVGQVIDTWGGGVVGLTDVAGGVGLAGLGGDDLGGGEGAALGDLGGLTDGAGGGRGGGSLGGGDVKDVEGAAGGGFLGGWLGRVVRNVVAVHDVLLNHVSHHD